GAARRRHVRVRITAQPRLYARIEIHDIALETKFDELDARHFDRQVEQEIAFSYQRLEHGAVILARERLDGEPDAEMLGLLDAARVAGHDADALDRHVNMAQKQRQSPLPDRTEAHDDEPALKLDVFLIVHFLFPGSADFCAVEFSILSAALSKKRGRTHGTVISSAIFCRANYGLRDSGARRRLPRARTRDRSRASKCLRRSSGINRRC